LRGSAARAFVRRSAPSRWALSSVALYALVVLTLGLLREDARLPLGDVAATAAAVAAGKAWLLLTSGAVAEGNLPLSVAGVAALGLGVLLVCGWRVLWIAGGLGHVGSALGTYATLDLLARARPDRFAPLLHTPDYGISAFAAGGLGALAVGAWQRRTEWPLTVLWSSLVLASLGSLVLMTLHVLDPFWFEHLPAFAIGAGVAYALRHGALPATLAHASAEP
jgi:hypothetical protein